MKTAVEFLKGELDKFVRCEFGDDPYIRYTLKDLYNAFEQAKQMEKEQIIDTFVEVTKTTMETFKINLKENDIEDFKYIAEQYYNETYKNTNE